MIYIVYLVVGLLAGIIGGLLGTGGCALIMPVIRFGFNFDPAFAVGTTLTAVVFTAGSGAIQHFMMRNVDLATALQVGLSGILGVIVGSFVFGYIKMYGELDRPDNRNSVYHRFHQNVVRRLVGHHAASAKQRNAGHVCV